MAGNETARVLHTEPAFSQGLGKIAELRDNRKARTEEHERQGRRNREPHRGRPAGERGTGRATREPRPGFTRAPAGGEPRAAERPADHISADIGRPHDSEDPQQRCAAVWAAAREPQQANARKRHPERAKGGPFWMQIWSPLSGPEDDPGAKEGESDSQPEGGEGGRRNRRENDPHK